MPAGFQAEVRLRDRPVGVLTYDRGGSRFIYEDDLVRPDHHVLGQTFEDDPRTVRRARTGLPTWFANLLPEGELRRQLAREMSGGRVGDYRLLLWLGHDLPGAVTVHADGVPADDDGPPPEIADRAPDEDEGPRWSLAGVQLKWSVHTVA